jgi:polar amino acid transport system substrate-binding protein
MRVRNRFPHLLAVTILATGLFATAQERANADELDTIKQRGTLIVGVKADYPPFGFSSSTGDIKGIEPDLAADIARHLGVKLVLVAVTASNRMQFLEEGKIDLIIATMNDTKERSAEVDMVKPYYDAAGYNIMAPRAMNLKSWSELQGKPVCGVKDAYYNYQATMNFKLQITTYPGPVEALSALQQGRCVGYLFDDTSIKGDLLEPKWSDYEMPLDSQEVQPWALAVQKNQPEWAAYLSDMVKQWVTAGTILDLETKYHVGHSKFAEQAHEKALSASGN